MPRTIILFIILALPALASAQQMLYRYLDQSGRVVYTDTTPPLDARSVQQKKLGGNFIDTSEAPYALQVAQQRNPVTLYSGNCGPVCDQARALLNRRGVPFQDIDPSQPTESAKLKSVTGDLQVPVLVIGAAQLLKGFEEGKWQSALDQAGYPKTPAVRITALKRDGDRLPTEKGTPKAAAVKAAGKSDPGGDANSRSEPATAGTANDSRK